MTAEEKSVLSLFMIGVLIVVGKVLAGGEPITPRLFIGQHSRDDEEGDDAAGFGATSQFIGDRKSVV